MSSPPSLHKLLLPQCVDDRNIYGDVHLSRLDRCACARCVRLVGGVVNRLGLTAAAAADLNRDRLANAGARAGGDLLGLALRVGDGVLLRLHAGLLRRAIGELDAVDENVVAAALGDGVNHLAGVLDGMDRRANGVGSVIASDALRAALGGVL